MTNPETDATGAAAGNANPESPKPAEPAASSPVNKSSESLFDPSKIGLLSDLNINVTIEIGRAELKIRDLLNLSKGSIIELNKMSGEPVEIYANGKLISLGEIITVNGRYCVRLLNPVQPSAAAATGAKDGK